MARLASFRRLHPGSRSTGRRCSGLSRRRADRKAAGRQVLHGNYAAQKYDNPPEAYGAFAYAAMALILDSIEKVGPDRKKVIDEMAK
jgi:hypothetical protein